MIHWCRVHQYIKELQGSHITIVITLNQPKYILAKYTPVPKYILAKYTPVPK